MTTDNQVSPEDLASVFVLQSNGRYYKASLLHFTETSPNEVWWFANPWQKSATQSEKQTQPAKAQPQDDFIRKGRGVLLALGFGLVFWVLVFLLIGGV